MTYPLRSLEILGLDATASNDAPALASFAGQSLGTLESLTIRFRGPARTLSLVRFLGAIKGPLGNLTMTGVRSDVTSHSRGWAKTLSSKISNPSIELLTSDCNIQIFGAELACFLQTARRLQHLRMTYYDRLEFQKKQIPDFFGLDKVFDSGVSFPRLQTVSLPCSRKESKQRSIDRTAPHRFLDAHSPTLRLWEKGL